MSFKHINHIHIPIQQVLKIKPCGWNLYICWPSYVDIPMWTYQCPSSQRQIWGEIYILKIFLKIKPWMKYIYLSGPPLWTYQCSSSHKKALGEIYILTIFYLQKQFKCSKSNHASEIYMFVRRPSLLCGHTNAHPAKDKHGVKCTFWQYSRYRNNS